MEGASDDGGKVKGREREREREREVEEEELKEEGGREGRICLLHAGPRGRRIDPEAAAVIRPLIKCQSPTSSPVNFPCRLSFSPLSFSPSSPDYTQFTLDSVSRPL